MMTYVLMVMVRMIGLDLLHDLLREIGVPRPDEGLVRSRLWVLDVADHEFEAGDFLRERGVAGFGEADPGAGTFAGVTFLDGDEPGVFQHAEMLGQVACGQFERVAQVAEIGSPCLVRDGKYAEPHPLMNDVVKPVRGMPGHGAGVRRGRWPRAKPMPPSSSTLPSITRGGTKSQGGEAWTQPKVMGTSTTAR